MRIKRDFFFFPKAQPNVVSEGLLEGLLVFTKKLPQAYFPRANVYWGHLFGLSAKFYRSVSEYRQMNGMISI